MWSWAPKGSQLQLPSAISTVAASRCWIFLALFRAFSVEMAVSTPHAAGRLPAVYPDVAKLLAVAALRETRLRLVEFNFYCCIAKAGYFKVPWDGMCVQVALFWLGLCGLFRFPILHQDEFPARSHAVFQKTCTSLHLASQTVGSICRSSNPPRADSVDPRTATTPPTLQHGQCSVPTLNHSNLTTNSRGKLKVLVLNAYITLTLLLLLRQYSLLTSTSLDFASLHFYFTCASHFWLICSSLEQTEVWSWSWSRFYDRRSVGQSILVSGPYLGPMASFYNYRTFAVFILCAPSLTRGRICNLFVQFAVNLRSKSSGNQDHILQSHLRPPPQPGGPCPCIKSPRNRVGCPSYTSWHCVPFTSPLTTRRDYGGGILTRLHTGKSEIFLLYHI
jgi:hypothetical protein